MNNITSQNNEGSMSGGKIQKNSSNGVVKDNYHTITVTIKQVKPK